MTAPTLPVDIIDRIDALQAAAERCGRNHCPDTIRARQAARSALVEAITCRLVPLATADLPPDSRGPLDATSAAPGEEGRK